MVYTAIGGIILYKAVKLRVMPTMGNAADCMGCYFSDAECNREVKERDKGTMSKIEEMAEKAYPDFPFIDGKSGRRMMMSDSNMRNAYKNGAIKVLEEIENAYNSGGVVAALDKFRELKS